VYGVPGVVAQARGGSGSRPLISRVGRDEWAIELLTSCFAMPVLNADVPVYNAEQGQSAPVRRAARAPTATGARHHDHDLTGCSRAGVSGMRVPPAGVIRATGP
jgi:hypothetical protein